MDKKKNFSRKAAEDRKGWTYERQIALFRQGGFRTSWSTNLRTKDYGLRTVFGLWTKDYRLMSPGGFRPPCSTNCKIPKDYRLWTTDCFRTLDYRPTYYGL